MMTKKEMIDNVIKKYGFENEYTIWFCRLAEEDISDDLLLGAYVLLNDVMFCEED